MGQAPGMTPKGLPGMPADPARRSLAAQIAAHSLHSRVDPVAHTAPARAASPGSLDYWTRQVDPDGRLDPADRRRRAEHAKKAHFLRLALKSAEVRRARAASPDAA